MKFLKIIFILLVVEFNLIGQITKDNYKQYIDTIWNNRFSYFERVALKSDSDSNNLYYIQVFTNNFLNYCYKINDLKKLDQLAQIYLIPLHTLKETSNYYAIYCSQIENSNNLVFDHPYKMWLTCSKKGNVPCQEVILYSSQYLYLIARTINLFLDVPRQSRTKNMEDIIQLYPSIIVYDHYLRWIYGSPFLQQKGWGCSDNCFNLYDLTREKLNRSLANKPNYCNALADQDLWIPAGIAEIIGAYYKHPDDVKINLADIKRLKNYLSLSSSLIKSRLSESRLYNFEGKEVKGINFELGSWDDYIYNQFDGYTDNIFPSDKNIIIKNNVGWDLSHARRFVHVFNSLYDNKKYTGMDFPDLNTMTGLANQFAYGVFNKDFKRPLFYNFMDGTNGWYRVNYEGRKGFGYGPYDLSTAAITGGFGFWQRFNTDIKKIMIALLDMINSKDPNIREHFELHYGFYINYPTREKMDFVHGYNNSLDLFQFLPIFIDD